MVFIDFLRGWCSTCANGPKCNPAKDNLTKVRSGRIIKGKENPYYCLGYTYEKRYYVIVNSKGVPQADAKGKIFAFRNRVSAILMVDRLRERLSGMEQFVKFSVEEHAGSDGWRCPDELRYVE